MPTFRSDRPTLAGLAAGQAKQLKAQTMKKTKKNILLAGVLEKAAVRDEGLNGRCTIVVAVQVRVPYYRNLREAAERAGMSVEAAVEDYLRRVILSGCLDSSIQQAAYERGKALKLKVNPRPRAIPEEHPDWPF
jgi:hypothetical protein